MTAIWVMIGVFAVLLVGGGAFALGTFSMNSDDSVTPPQEAKPPSGSGGAGRSGGSSTSVDPHSPQGVARSISALMADSRMDKSEIGRSASDLGACRNIAAGIRTFEDAAASRQRLKKEAGRLDASGLHGGQAVVDELRQAWSIAAQADAAYAEWGQSVHQAGGKCVGDKAALKRATELSDRSHPHKQAAADEWKPIAHKYGLPTVKWDQL